MAALVGGAGHEHPVYGIVVLGTVIVAIVAIIRYFQRLIISTRADENDEKGNSDKNNNDGKTRK
jgi:hypothetical protein